MPVTSTALPITGTIILKGPDLGNFDEVTTKVEITLTTFCSLPMALTKDDNPCLANPHSSSKCSVGHLEVYIIASLPT